MADMAEDLKLLNSFTEDFSGDEKDRDIDSGYFLLRGIRPAVSIVFNHCNAKDLYRERLSHNLHLQ